MTKSELVKAIALSAGLSQIQATAALESFQSVITDTVKRGESVVLQNFVKFEQKERAARAGRNPQTGEALQIAAKTVITAKCLIK